MAISTIDSTGLAAAGISQSNLGVGVAGNGPSFSAYASGATQVLANNTWTKIQYNSEWWDTASCYDTTLYRFTPNVAGYYQVSARLNMSPAGANVGEVFIALYKNGSAFKRISDGLAATTQAGIAVQGACLVYCNGSTDYLEIFVYQSSGTTYNTNYFSGEGSWFDAALVRSA